MNGKRPGITPEYRKAKDALTAAAAEYQKAVERYDALFEEWTKAQEGWWLAMANVTNLWKTKRSAMAAVSAAAGCYHAKQSKTELWPANPSLPKFYSKRLILWIIDIIRRGLTRIENRLNK